MSPKFTVLFCDDVRREDNGKVLLIGVYSGNIVPNTIPASFVLSLYVLVSDLPVGEREFELKLLLPGNKGQVIAKGEMEVKAGGPLDPMIFAGMPVQIREPGDIVVTMQFEGAEPEEIGRISIVHPDELLETQKQQHS